MEVTLARRGLQPANGLATETVEAEGHLIDSGDLQAILTTIIEHNATYEILRLDVGRTNADGSRVALKLHDRSPESLQDLLEKLSPIGCFVAGAPDALVRECDVDGAAPEDFYSTTNHRTLVRVHGQWLDGRPPTHGRCGGPRRPRCVLPQAARPA